jgi:hypothetical protein
MQITQVLTIENKNTNSIHLVQDALFFRAYEKSAWLFGKYFKDYKVNCRYYKNIQQELLWLGFPSSILAKYRQEAEEQGWSVQCVNASHYVFSLPQNLQEQGLRDYQKWREQHLLKKAPSETLAPKKVPEAVLVGFRLCYDFALDIYRVSSRLNRDYRFSLGERLRKYSSELVECFHLWANGNPLQKIDSENTQWLVHRIRLELRMLKDLLQIKEKRWLQLNENLDSVMQQIDFLQSSLIRNSAK